MVRLEGIVVSRDILWQFHTTVIACQLLVANVRDANDLVARKINAMLRCPCFDPLKPALNLIAKLSWRQPQIAGEAANLRRWKVLDGQVERMSVVGAHHNLLMSAECSMVASSHQDRQEDRSFCA